MIISQTNSVSYSQPRIPFVTMIGKVSPPMIDGAPNLNLFIQ